MVHKRNKQDADFRRMKGPYAPYGGMDGSIVFKPRHLPIRKIHYERTHLDWVEKNLG